MNSKLTPEQRIEKILEILNLFTRTLYQLDGSPDVIWAETFNEVACEIDKALTANTAEDEPCSECGGNGFIWNNMGLPVDCPKCMMLSNFEGVDG